MKSRAHGALATKSLGSLGAIALECTPPSGPSGSSKSHRSIGSYTIHPDQPTYSANAQPTGCNGGAPDDVQLGIIDGLGCWQEVDATHPLGAAEAKLLCGHKKQSDLCHYVRDSVGAALSLPTTRAAQSRLSAAGVINNATSLRYDAVWYSTGPVGIDGLEVDPVGQGQVVLARAGIESSGFTKGDVAVLLSSDAMVRVGGLPISLNVPDYTKLYAQGKSAVNCGQTVAGGVQSGDLSSADCLGSLSLPSLTDVANALKLPNIHGPIDLSVGPQSLGIELGSFEIPKDTLPLPVLPSLPLSGKIQVNLTGLDQASVGIHVELPVLSDGMGHGVTGDTDLTIDNRNGLELDDLDIKVPSLAQLGLARVQNLEFVYRKPSHFEGQGTIDLSDVIHGKVRLHATIDNKRLTEGDIHFFSGAGDGLPLFGPLFLTQADATLTLAPDVDIKGHALISVGPAVTNAGCGALGIDGNIDLSFGNPVSLTASGQASILCASLGPSKIFHADSDGNFSYVEHFHFGTPGDLNFSVDGDLGGTGYLNTKTGQLDFQIDGHYNAQGSYKKCVSFLFTECVDVGFNAGADGTLALGLHGGKPVGGTGVCLHLDTPIGGFDVGAGIDDLPKAILAAGTDNFPGLVSQLSVLLSGCDISKWRLLKPGTGFRSAHAAGATYTVPVSADQKLTIIGLQGQGGAPAVMLSGPGGKKVDTSLPGITLEGNALVVRQTSTGQTVVELPKADAGSWSITPLPGSAPITAVEAAQSLPAPKITTTVSGHGLKRLLRYHVAAAAGLSVTFAEGVDGGARTLGVAQGASGTILFTPALGSHKQRTIIARASRNGLALPSIVVGHFQPGAIRPGRPSQITVRRVGKSWHLAWHPAANATKQLLTIRFIDGVQVLLAAGATQRSLTLSRALDANAQPTAIDIVGLRGTVRGPVGSAVARHAPRKR